MTGNQRLDSVPAGLARCEKYRVESVLGHGGMAAVFGAYDMVLKRRVALKVFYPRTSDEPSAVQRFSREAQFLAQVEHPNLVRIYGIEEIGELLVMVMAQVEGETLSALLRRKQRLGETEAVSIVRQVAAGLKALHQQNIVHRDIKPGNVMVDAQGHVTLLDLGIAWTPTEALTRPGSIIGTIRYMSPEHILGQPLDGRSDLYSLALLFYETVTGRMPFDCQTDVDWFHAHLGRKPLAASLACPTLGPRFDNLLDLALAKEPEQRPASVEHWVQLIDSPNSAPRRPRGTRLRWLLPLVALVALVGLIALPRLRPPERAQPSSPTEPVPNPVVAEARAPIEAPDDAGPAPGEANSEAVSVPAPVEEGASLRVVSRSGWAELVVDGRKKYFSPALVKLSPGSHTLEIRKLGSASSRKVVQISPGEHKTLTID